MLAFRNAGETAEARNAGSEILEERPSCSRSHQGRIRILIVGADAILFALLEEWFGACECVLEQVQARAGAASNSRYDLVIVDVPFPRQGGAEAIRRVAREQPATPFVPPIGRPVGARQERRARPALCNDCVAREKRSGSRE